MEIRSFLQETKGAREKSGRDMAANLRKATMARRSEVRSTMNGLRKSREKETREYHDKATAFMRDLTNGVAGMLAKFSKEDRERGVRMHQMFASYGRDRMEARAVWEGNLSHRHGGAQASHHSTPMGGSTAESKHEASSSHHEPKHEASAPHAESKHEAGSSHSAEASSRASRHPLTSSSQRDSSGDRSGKGMK
ncbi:hypothetical protein B1812_16610 [Methylocystis bryophila]|uniref:Uncharacterized protein n=1 Tax=Methylocystis bryophila TaxID=655015 RepID=A0A1W6MXY4_9HYPH|nr:hypothetical protein B1812_16610 [Methylocystis bryophila]